MGSDTRKAAGIWVTLAVSSLARHRGIGESRVVAVAGSPGLPGSELVHRSGLLVAARLASGIERRHRVAGLIRDREAGRLELMSAAGDRAYRTTVVKGRFAFDRVLPSDSFKARLHLPDGTTTKWLNLGPLHPGRHVINLSF